ncbi:CRP/FNR family transcriptional regulator [Chromohalobacter marismortui]|uniref:CRP/FNR family transcriptional regulator n=1 Tax=Chromohalobacter marismortui TaxID=42055 RepID=A0A4R7NQM9_9GAMM|nr:MULTISPECIES: helix-turn-helix domain-containing protein [Chromohalobacter]MCI0508472.1 helix-turn-helix domain-containing protein [Chromohalobacter sp.]MCI0591808.1 helix-turn-helix domain-containing protein [Chromohalobacter sp.]TDU22952.1 CRP/FNR family transcriptional regulator [Chromohalobacter marismortui]
MTSQYKASRFMALPERPTPAYRLSGMCLPAPLSVGELETFSAISRQISPLRKRQTLFAQGEALKSLYIVRCGSLKQVYRDITDEAHITQFYLPGEVVGLDAISTGFHPGTTQALETTSVCEILPEALEEFSRKEAAEKGGNGCFLRVMSRALHQERMMVRLLLNRTSDVRLASFLLALSTRFRQQGYSPFCFRLSMSRSDIGNYLGLAVETVSRLLGRFQDLGLLTAKGREIRVDDLDGLMALADGRARQSIWHAGIVPPSSCRLAGMPAH